MQFEHPIPVLWDNLQLEIGFRADLIVNDLVIVETKSVETIHPVHKKQLLTYLRLTDKRLGLLINFNVELLKHGMYESRQRSGGIGESVTQRRRDRRGNERAGSYWNASRFNQQLPNLCVLCASA